MLATVQLIAHRPQRCRQAWLFSRSGKIMKGHVSTAQLSCSFAAPGHQPEEDSSDLGLEKSKARPAPAYTVELWNETRDAVEQVLAMTISAGIGFAAYYAATREYPNRYITLRHRDAIVSRWNGPAQ